MNRFENRIVLITGAASGIGEASALRIAQEGGSVICADMDVEGVEQTVSEIGKNGGEAIALACDVSDQDSVNKTVERGVEKYGKLNALCNIAGILRFDKTLEAKMEDFDRIIKVNLNGTFMMCQAALPHLIETKGSIVNMASTAALGAHAWTAAYSASKGAVLALTKCLAVEFGRLGVNVNALCPSSIATPMVDAVVLPEGIDISLLKKVEPFDGKFRPPSDVAGAVAFMHSVASPSFDTFRSVDPAGAALELKTLMLDNVDVISSMNGITVSNGRLNLNDSAIAIRDWNGAADPIANFSATPTSGDELC